MKQIAKRLMSLFIVAVTIFSLMPCNAQASSGNNLVITSYSLTNTSGNLIGSIQKGQQANLQLTLKDTRVKSSQISSKSDIDVSKLVDSFSTGTGNVEIISSGDKPLEFTVTFSKITYSGSGHSIRLMVGYKGLTLDYETVEASISETVEYEQSKPVEPTYNPETIPAPMVLVSRSDIKEPIEAGKEITLTITFKNLGSTTIKSPVASFSPSEALYITGNSSSFAMSDISPGQTGSVAVTVRATDNISSPLQSLGTELKFNYYNGSSQTQSSVSDKISIPAKTKVKDSNPQPMVIITRRAISKPVSAGEEMSLTISFKNTGKTELITPVASLSTSEGLILLSDASAFELENIEPGKSAKLTINIKAAKEISSANQSISIDLKYSYNSGDTITQASTSDKISISTNTNSMESPVPNLIISIFDYGGKPVAAGEKFTLSFTIKNTSSQMKAENIVAAVESSESFNMDGSTNTYYYKSLAAGGEQQQKIPMQAMATAKTGAQAINISFKYEYVDKNKRLTSNASIKLSIPVYQPDRFQINAPVLPETATVGEELSISVPYVNKGKSEISNVEAAIDGDVPTIAKMQNLGNFESGKSGSIGFAITPDKAGEIDFVLKISYEDSNQEVKTREFPVKLKVQEAAPVVTEEVPVETHKNVNWIWIAGIIALAGLGCFLIIKKKKKSATKESENEWDEWVEEYLCSVEEQDITDKQTVEEE